MIEIVELVKVSHNLDERKGFNLSQENHADLPAASRIKLIRYLECSM